MKVVYVDISLGFGGAFKSLALAFRGLPRVDKVLVTTQDDELVKLWFPGARIEPYRRLINYRRRTKLEAIPGAVARWLALKAFAVVDALVGRWSRVRLTRFFNRERPDVIHLNNWFIPEVQAAARAASVPCVVHVRDVVSDMTFYDPQLAGQANAIIAISNAVQQSLHAKGVPDSLLTRIYDPVDVAAIDRAGAARSCIRAEHGVRDDMIAMGIFGRVAAWKGQEEYARAAIGAMRAIPNLVAFIVGDQTDPKQGYFQRVREIITDSGMTDRFVLTGYRANVEEYYAAMDILVHASTTPEPFGMVVIEGMAASLPVIATAGGGPLDVVSPGGDGLLVPMGDVPALEAAMMMLAGDAELRRRMGAAGRAKVVAKFGIDAHAASLAAVYESVRASSKRLP